MARDTPTLLEVLERLKQLGCVIRVVSAPIPVPGTETEAAIRYVYNPVNDMTVYIQETPDDAPVGMSRLRYYERILKVRTGLPGGL